MTVAAQNPERLLLSDALDIDPATIALHSREPLGAGSVTGFEVAGAEPLLYFVDTSRASVPIETGWASDDVRIWMHPADPHLPALASIAFDHTATTILTRLGFTVSEVPQIIAYRPGRRAVLRARVSDSDIWIKVTRPSRIETLVRAQAAAAHAGVPVPDVHAWSPDGLVFMADAAGVPAADFHWQPERLLDEVDSLRAQFRTVQWDRPAPGVSRRIRWYASRADHSATAVLDRARVLIEDGSAARPDVVIHGDLHFGQLFLDEHGSVRSVLDVDTLGIGDPAEDSAAFLSHAIVSAALTGDANQRRVWALADAAAQRWGGDTLVRALTAVHLVGHSISAMDRAANALAEQSLAAADAVLHGSAPSAGGA